MRPYICGVSYLMIIVSLITITLCICDDGGKSMAKCMETNSISRCHDLLME